MNVEILNTMILRRKKYSLINIEYNKNIYEENPFLLEEFEIQKGEIRFGDYEPRIYATYLFYKKELFLEKLTFQKNAFIFSDVVETRLSNDEKLETLNVMDLISFTGKIRLANDPAKDLYVYADREYPIAFKTVLDITLEGGYIVNINDRSQEMNQRRGVLNKLIEAGKMAHPIDVAFSHLEW